MKIQSRLLLLTISTSLIAMAAVLLVSTYLIRESVVDGVSQKLNAVLEARVGGLDRYLDTIHREMHILSSAPTTINDLTVLSGGYAKLGSNAQTLLQQNYLAEVGTQNNSKSSAMLGSDYARALPSVNQYFLSRHDIYKWDDIYLIDSQGNVVFSILKKQDFGTNLISGPWKDTGLARAVTPLLHTAVPGVISFADFSNYAPTADRKAVAFVAMPVFDSDKQVFLGVVAIQLPLQQINDLMKDTTGLGESGETFIVDKNGLMLTDLRIREGGSSQSTLLNAQAVKKVLNGESGLEQLVDYRGIDVFVAFKLVKPFQDASVLGDPAQWGVIVKIDKEDVYTALSKLYLHLLLTGAGLAVFAAFIGWWGARGISQPLIQIKNALTKLAKSELVEIPGLERHDEIGEMGKAAETFRQVTQQVQREHWISENVLVLTDAVSTETHIDKAADSLLHLLCERLDVPVGAIYLLSEGVYKCVGAHGLARRSQIESVFQLGVGVLGQCAKDNQALVISPVPSGLSIISTGLTEFPPHELVLYPVAHKDAVLAVLELAAIKSLDPLQHEFLQEVSGKLGLLLANLQAAEHNLLLLAETSRQAVELRSSSRYARSLIEASLDPLVTIGPDGKIMDVNAATENVTGLARGRLIGSDFSDYFTEPEMARAGYKQVFTQGYVTDYPLAIRHASGKITDVLYNASVFRDAQGEVAGIFAAARDITEKKMADAKMQQQQEELRTSSLYARSLIEASLDPLVTIGPDGKIMDVNTATENVTGLARERLIGSDFSDYFTEPEMARTGYEQVFAQGYVTDYPLAIRHASGKITDVLYNACVFRDAQGEVAGIFAAARDITEKKMADAMLKEQQDELLRTNAELHALTEELRSQSEELKTQNEELKTNEEELRAQQEELKHKNQTLQMQSAQLKEMLAESNTKADDLQRANQYKSEFLANMSHELRTPLNSVMILSRNLAENAEKNLTQEQIESATVISESGTQLLTLINDILDLSKIEAGKLLLQKETFLLNELLDYLRRIFSSQTEKKNLAFKVQVDPALPETINTDRQRLTQVMSNLLANAIKFTDSGEVSVLVSKDHDDLLIEIADTGIGIPADKLEQIFGAFQQVDGSNTRKYGGSGLGLAISRHLTELLGGSLEVKSQPGKGSRFTVRLFSQFANIALADEPLDNVVLQGSLDQPAVASMPGGCILVVEDDTRLSAILGRMITALGFTPQCVESAEMAITAIDKGTPMGILVDLGLPHMSGVELLRRLKANNATARIPFYIISGTIDTGEAKVLGALGFLKKPVTRDTLAAAIKMMITAGQAPHAKRILLAEGDPADIESIQKLFKQDALEVAPVNTGSAALQLLQTQRFDTVILGLNLPDMTGFEWLKQASKLLNPPPLVVYSNRELSEVEVFELKEVAESIVNKAGLNVRLRDEVLRAVQLDGGEIVAAENESGSSKNLLLVDDDARNLFALTKVLRAKGFVIEVAPDSATALKALQQGHFDAVLTDIMMPEMDGYALIRQIRDLGYSDMPIVAITAKAMPGDDELCLQAGATAYLSKPVDMDKLLNLLKEIQEKGK